jgi:hypothetical protein
MSTIIQNKEITFNLSNISDDEMTIINKKLSAYYNYDETSDLESLIELLDEYCVSYPINDLLDDCVFFRLIKLDNNYLISLKEYEHDDCYYEMTILNITTLSNYDEVSNIIDVFTNNKKLSNEVSHYEEYSNVKAA